MNSTLNRRGGDNEPQGPYLAILMILEAMADAGALDRSAVAAIGGRLAKKGRELNEEGFQVEGGELLRLADATSAIHDRLHAKE